GVGDPVTAGGGTGFTGEAVEVGWVRFAGRGRTPGLRCAPRPVRGRLSLGRFGSPNGLSTRRIIP
ncbi:hypothetical protein, partial [Mycobacterium marinum]